MVLLDVIIMMVHMSLSWPIMDEVLVLEVLEF